jgi:hypothetical protein
MYRYLDEAVHTEVLDYPGVISLGATLEEARRMLASALVDMDASAPELGALRRHRGRHPGIVSTPVR